MARRFIIFSVFFVFASTIFAQTTGKIKGKVVDDKGEPMPYANVYIEGTTMGAATNMDGDYVILNVPVGTYILVASVIGYATSKVSDVKVSVDMTTTINFKLSSSAIKGEEVVVTAKRPVIERDMTSSSTRMSGNEITQMPTTSYQQVVATQTGAAQTSSGLSGGLHIRGGRNNEVVYIVDGINTTDPVTGQAGAMIDNNAISEMLLISGGFDAEYGNAMSGVVNIVTNEGSAKPSGTLQYTTDGIFPKGNLLSKLLLRDTMPVKGVSFDSLVSSNSVFNQGYNFGYNDIGLTYGGPIPVVKNLNFFTSLGYHANSTYLPQDDGMEQQGTLKFAYKVSNSMKATLSSNYSYKEGHLYSQGLSRGTWLEDAPFYNTGNSQINLKFNHSLSSKTFYTVNIGRFNTYTNEGAQQEIEDNSLMGKIFNRHKPRDFHDFREIGTGLPWVAFAYDSGWYNPKTKEWRYGWSEEKAWRYFYSNVYNYGYYDAKQDKWIWNSGIKATDIRDAMMSRCYQNSSYSVGHGTGNNLPEGDSLVYKVDDTTYVYCHKFDLGNYIADVNKYIKDTTGTFTTDSMEPSGDLYLMRYNGDPEFGIFSYYFTPSWDQRNTVRWSFSSQLTSQMNKYNEVKMGLEGEKNYLQYTSVQFVNPNPYLDHYNKSPITADGYIADKIEYEDLVLKLGLRADYFNPMDSFYIRMDSLQAGKEQVQPKYDFSPRFGISYAVSDKAVMYANYGQFFQPENFADIYQNLNADLTNGVPILGNPNLPPEKETMYETGFRYALNPDFSMDISGYFKNVGTLLDSRQMSTIFKNKPVSYTVFELQDFAVVKGADIVFTKRASEYLSGSFSYSYQQARGTGSSPWEGYYYYSGATQAPDREYPLEYDITHTIKANLNLFLPEKFGPAIYGVKPFSNLNTNLQFSYSSGAPYTPEDPKTNMINGDINSMRMPSITTADIRIDKGFSIGGKNLSLFVTINNVLNMKNIVYVYPTSGSAIIPGIPVAYDSTYYQSLYQNYLNRPDAYREMLGYTSPRDMYDKLIADWKRYYDSPTNYSNPRLIRIGLQFKF